MNFFNVFFKKSCWIAALALSTVACKDSDDTEPDSSLAGGKYGITVRVEAAGERYEYILPVEDLMTDGSISPVGYGIDVSGKVDASYGVREGANLFFTEGAAVKRYSVATGAVVEKGNAVLSNPGNYLGMMKSAFIDGRLNFINWASTYNATTEASEKRLFIIDTATMVVKGETALSFPVPLIEDPENVGEYFNKADIPISPTSLGIANGKIYVGFLYLKPSWAAPEKQVAYVLTADYPSLTNQKIASNDQYGHTTGTWYQTKSSFFDEDGNYYFTTIRENTYYTLLRVKAGSTEIDPDYAFDLSNYSLYSEGFMGQQTDQYAYLKDGKALLGAYVFDVHNKTLIKNLNDSGFGSVQSVPADGVLVEGSKAYMFVKSADSKWYVAAYDADTNEFKRGIQIQGGITRAFGIVKY
ncbi:hypothetical protein [Sphingobacterium sp. LRF_L2]|uniref:hypothetical protein n=1 Tax=Sphingobacterium sp. LRF_L2 TaxID=3369421 RepID=UPI003F6054CF